MIIENIIQNKVITFKNVNRTENENERIIKFLGFCSTFILLIEIEQET